MGTEFISINGEHVETLKELLRPGLKAVFIGLNPSPVSVAAGHYYQGRLGRRLWTRLQTYQITGRLTEGREDEAAFAQGFGFADVVRRPTARATELSNTELQEGANALLGRFNRNALGRPLIVFVFKRAADAVGSTFRENGYCTYRLPSPYVPRTVEQWVMLELRSILKC